MEPAGGGCNAAVDAAGIRTSVGDGQRLLPEHNRLLHLAPGGVRGQAPMLQLAYVPHLHSMHCVHHMQMCIKYT